MEKLPKQVFVGSQSVGALNLKKNERIFSWCLKASKTLELSTYMAKKEGQTREIACFAVLKHGSSQLEHDS